VKIARQAWLVKYIIALIWVSLFIYIAVGYWGAHRRGFLFGVLLGSFAGLTDSTIGWWVSTSIRPFSRTEIPPLSLFLQLIVLISVTALGFVFSLIGAGLCKLLRQTRPA
jgi:hypothetical protein